MYHGCLILAQFALAAVLVLSADWRPMPWLAVVIALPGAALSIWAWLAIGVRRIRIHPTTTDETEFVRSGPYAIVRHPMYTGLLWATAALLISGFAWWRVALWIALLVVLLAKLREEEAAMRERFSDYDDYRRRVAALVPLATRLRS